MYGRGMAKPVTGGGLQRFGTRQGKHASRPRGVRKVVVWEHTVRGRATQLASWRADEQGEAAAADSSRTKVAVGLHSKLLVAQYGALTGLTSCN